MSDDENQLLKDETLWGVQASLFDSKTFVLKEWFLDFCHSRQKLLRFLFFVIYYGLWYYGVVTKEKEE